MKGISPARAAREAAGLGREEAAQRAGITLTYLRSVERVGASYVLARRLARIYGCAIDSFLPPPGGGTPRKGGGRSRTSRPRAVDA
jgi:transcriptional regulator with XRE-family HTH domain